MGGQHMKLNFVTDVGRLLPGIEALQHDLGFTCSKDGIPVQVTCRPGNLQVRFDGHAHIQYGEKHHFFRALSLLVQHLQTGQAFELIEEPQFKTVGPMFDVSRNAVISVDTFKYVLRKLGMMGLNTAMLYMEDVYELPNTPYFGYLRGRYTETELRAMDEYADRFGIEIIPSIQTLAHLEEFLKWNEAKSYRDTRGVLLTDAEDTYSLLDEMIGTMKRCFKSRRIHIGMDESEELGRGRHLDKFGYEPRLDIFTRHLNKVLEIVKHHDLSPMMWSDMLIKLASGSGEDYYAGNDKLPEDVVNKTPKDVQMVYWDYYHLEQSDYERLIKTHQQFGATPAFAGGIWIWGTFGANYNYSLQATESALRACKAQGVEDVFITLWGDDGNESNFMYTLAGFELIAEHAYHPVPEQAAVNARVKFHTGLELSDFVNLSYLDETESSIPLNPRWDNPSKFLLWQDPLLGVFDKQVEGLALSKHYADLETKFRAARLQEAEFSPLFEVPEKLCAVLAIKSELGIQMKQAYDSSDFQALRYMASDILPELGNHVDDLREAHRAQWLRTFKAFGWEVLDIRYGGLLARISSTQDRLMDFIEGRTDGIEELEQERLPFAGQPSHSDAGRVLGRLGHYYRAASPNVFFHVLPITGW